MVGSSAKWWALIYNRYMSILILVSFSAFVACGDEEAAAAAAAAAESEKKKEVAAAAVEKNVGDANVTSVFAREDADSTWTFHVTVKHDDVNWDDYADGWDLILSDGVPIKPDKFSGFTKAIRHPHVDEQPFTRTQRGIVLPEGTTTVTARAHDKKGGWGGEEITVDLNQRFGENFSVKRKL
jgi:hypothetical protein